MTPENTLGGDSSAPTTEPMPDPVIDPTVPATPVENPDPVIDPTAPTGPAPTPVVEPTAPAEPQSLGDDPTKTLDQPATPEAAPAPVVDKPKNKGKLIGIIVAAVVVLALIILAIVLLPKAFTNVDTAKYDDNAFFAEESNGSDSFAIFTRDGQRVTDFIYSNVSGFTNGHAAACSREDSSKCGVVTSAGTVSLEFGAYDSVSSVGGLYIVTRGSKRLLVNYAGQQITELASDDDANADLFVRDTELPLVVYNYGDNKYKLYNSEGEELLDFESTSRPALFHSDQMAVGFMSTDSKLYAIDSNEQKIIAETNSDYIYNSVKDVSSDGKMLIIQSENQKNKNRHYALYSGEKITPVNSDECEDLIFAEDDNGSKMNYANCKIHYSKYMIDEKGNVSHESSYGTKRINSDTYVVNEYYSGELGEEKAYYGYVAKFFKNGKQVKQIAAKDLSIESVSANGYYVFYNSKYSSDDYQRLYYVYNTEGEEVFKYEFETKSYSNGIYGLDSNGNYIISAQGEDEKGNKHTYYSVIKPDGTFVIEKKDSTIREFHGLYLVGSYTIEAILDKNGKQISTENQKYYDIEMVGNNFIMASNSYNNVTEIYSLSGKKLTSSEKKVSASVHKNYIAIKEGSKYKYYNIETGELIYAQ